MAQEPRASNQNGQTERKNISIEIEPSYPLIIAIAEFFRDHHKPQQSLDLCRRGLDYFPGDPGLRLGSALAYFELAEKEKAWMEIKSVVQELTQMTPVAQSIAKYFRDQGQNKFSEWFHQLSQVLSVSPEESLENSIAPPIPPLFPKEEFQTEVESKIEKNSPREPMEPKTFSQIPSQEISLFSPGKVDPETKRPPEGIPDSNILSTLTGWLSQLKESKV